jgi:general secretion pathway protein C
MKRQALIASFILFIVLCACAAYWAMQLFKPASRPVAAPPRVQAEVRTDTAAGLFGGRGGKGEVASNYQLRGVIFSGSGRDSVAIISADGKPAQAIRVNAEVVPGVTIQEVHRDYILLSDNGVTKRVELPENAKGQSNIATVGTTAPVPATTTSPRPTPAQPAPSAPPAPAQAPQQQPPPQPQQQPPPPAPAVQQQAPVAAPPTVQTAPPTMMVRPPAETPPLNPPSPSNDSGFGTPSPPLYSPGRAPAQ